MPQTARLRLMVTVKAYPTVSLKHSELVCCAGIREDTSEWVRLYPVRYRDLPIEQRFGKYDIIEVDCERRPPHKDDRPESWNPRMHTLKNYGEVQINRPGDWSDRMKRVRPTLLKGFAELMHLQQTARKSLAAFKPARILGFRVDEEEGEWTQKQLDALNQMDFYEQSSDTLEKMRYAFRIGFKDEKGAEHWLKIIDWEFAQLWRRERDRLGSPEQAAEQVRKKLEWIAQGDKEVIIFTGNPANPAMRRSFMVLGFCYPRSNAQMDLL